MFSCLLKATAIALALPLSVLANPHAHHNARHYDLAKRVKGDLSKRQEHPGSRWTYYEVGLGACGQYNGPGDFIVALNVAEYGDGYPGPHCFQQIWMEFEGKRTTATIMDMCPGCPWGGLDLSAGLFQFFAPLGAGVISGNWGYVNGGGGGGQQPQPTPTPTPTPTPPPSPTPSTTPPSPSTTPPASTPPPQSSTSSGPSASQSPINYSVGVAGGLASSSGQIADDGQHPQNILDANTLFVHLGGLSVAGAHVSDD